jgi:hypothetical protein
VDGISGGLQVGCWTYASRTKIVGLLLISSKRDFYSANLVAGMSGHKNYTQNSKYATKQDSINMSSKS